MVQTFHRDIGIPAPLAGALPHPFLRYGTHAINAARDERLTSLPRALPSQLTIIEVEATNGRASKWVIRFASKVPGRDLVLVVLADGFVKTVWCNDTHDTHNTLDRSRYTHPGAFRA